MPNLVGTGLNQVPTNSMLGGLAYQDPEHASIKNLDLKNLSQINSEIADTATDVFVYDTRKDSDGGAWRKRTQNTSWYNETLNTATRGSRKEFPAVAVIVSDASSDKVTIYDGDDPDLPMWMVFSAGNPRGIIGWATGSITRIKLAAMNGIMVAGTNDAGTIFKFVEDFVEIMYSSANYDIKSGRTIADRNNATAYDSVSGTAKRVFVIATYAINDVAMTVLPNAPIDDATGLPVPTIAVATQSGVSVIKDDGNVVDITSAQGGNYNQSKAITITEENYLWWLGDYNAGSTYLRDSYAVSLDNFPSSDFTWNNVNDNLSAGKYYALTTAGEAGEIKIGPVNTWAWNHQERNALGGPAGLAIHKPNIGSETNSLIAAITSDYNTGWMHGDIKGAFLSDTVTEKDGVNYALSAVAGGTNRLTSINYDDGDTAWQMVDNAGTANGYVNVDMRGLTIGQTYKISMTWSSNATLDSGYNHRVAHLNGLAGENGTDFTHWNKTNGSSETLTGIFTAQSVNDDDLVIYANAITLNISNFKIEETDDINGFEKLGNHDFTSDFTTEWEVTNNANTSYDATNDRVTVTSTQNYSGIQLRSTKLPRLAAGKRYIMTVDIHSITNPIYFGVVSGLTVSNVNAAGVWTGVFTASAVTEVFVKKSTGSNSTFVLNSVSIKEVEEDRSLNNKGLQVFGTVTKTAVATGAELVGYSGFSASNYLKQPYNSDLAPGTAAYSVSCWFKTGTSSGDQYIFDRNGGGSGSRNLLLIMNTSASGSSANKFQFWHRDNTGNITDIQIQIRHHRYVWHQCCIK